MMLAQPASLSSTLVTQQMSHQINVFHSCSPHCHLSSYFILPPLLLFLFFLCFLSPTTSVFVTAQSCHGYTNYPLCDVKDDCVWSSTSAVCSVTGPPNSAQSVGYVDGPSSSARFNVVTGIGAPNYYSDQTNSILYVSDFSNGVIRQMNVSSGEVSTLRTLNGPGNIALFDSQSNINARYFNHALIPTTTANSVYSMSLTPPYDLQMICGTGVQANSPSLVGPVPCDTTPLWYPFSLTIHSSGQYAILCFYNTFNIALIDLSITPHQIRTIAGSSTSGDQDSDSSGLSALFRAPMTTVFDPIDTHRVFVTDLNNAKIRQLTLINSDGTNISSLAVTSVGTFAGNELMFHDEAASAAVNTTLNGPRYCMIDTHQYRYDLYCSTLASIIRFDLSDPNAASSPVTSLTDSPGASDSPNNMNVAFWSPSQLAIMRDYVSRRIVLYIADQTNNKVRSVTLPPTAPTSIPIVSDLTQISNSAVVGNWEYDLHDDGGDAITRYQTFYNCPLGASGSNNAPIDQSSELSSTRIEFAGLPKSWCQFTIYCSNGFGNSASLPAYFLVDCLHGSTNWFDCDQQDECVWSQTSAVCSLTGSQSSPAPQSYADGSLISAGFSTITGVAAPNYYSDSQNSILYVSDFDNNAIRLVNTISGVVTTLVKDTRLNGPYNIALFDPHSNINPTYSNHLLIPSQMGGAIFSMTLTAPFTLELICGTGSAGAAGPVVGSCTNVQLFAPVSLTIHSSGQYAIISCNNVILLIDLSVAPHSIRTIAGTSSSGDMDSSSGLTAQFNNPTCFTFDELDPRYGYVCDKNNVKIRRVTIADEADASNLAIATVSTFAGSLHVGSLPSDQTADAAIDTTMNSPFYCMWDKRPHYMYCCSSTSIIKFDMTNSSAPSTAVTHLAGSFGAGDSLTGLIDPSVQFNVMSQLAMMRDFVSRRIILYIADQYNNKIRRVVLPPTPPTSPPVITSALPSSASPPSATANFTFDLHADGGDAITACTATAIDIITSMAASVTMSSSQFVIQHTSDRSSANSEIMSGSITIANLTRESTYSIEIMCSNTIGSSPPSSSLVVPLSPSSVLPFPVLASISPSAISLPSSSSLSSSSSSAGSATVTLTGANLDAGQTQVHINGQPVPVLPDPSSATADTSAAAGSSVVVVLSSALLASVPASTYATITITNPSQPALVCPGSSTLTSASASASTATITLHCPAFYSGLYFSPALVIPGLYCPSGSVNASACSLCPANAVCPSGNRVQPVAGYYTPDETLPVVYKCEDPTGERCVGYSGGGSLAGCGVGYVGTLCSQCDANYYAAGGVCLACGDANSSASPVLMSVLTFLFFGSLSLLVVFVSNDWLDLCAVFLTSFQRVLMSGAAIFVYFTPTARTVFNYFQLVRLDFSYLKGQCSGAEYDVVVQFFISLGVLGVIYAIFAVAALVYQYRTRHGEISQVQPLRGRSHQHIKPVPSLLPVPAHSSISFGSAGGGIELAPTSSLSLPRGKSLHSGDSLSVTVPPSSSFHSLQFQLEPAADFPVARPSEQIQATRTDANESNNSLLTPTPATTIERISFHWISNPRQPRLVRAMIFVFYITYLQLTTECLALFHCVEYPIYAALSPPTATSRLYSDQSVVCYSGLHSVVVGVAAPVLLFAVVGVPVGLVGYLRLLHHTNRLSDWLVRSRFGFLYRKVRSRCYWYRSLTFVLNFITALQVAIILPDLVTQFIISSAVVGCRLLFIIITPPFLTSLSLVKQLYWIAAQYAVVCFFLFVVRQINSSALLLSAQVLFGLSCVGFVVGFVVAQLIRHQNRGKK